MRRASITLTDELERDLEAFRARQPAPPSTTAVVQAALERYLATVDEPEPASGPLTMNDVLRVRGDIKAAAARHGAVRIHVFGSIARGEARAGVSDVDVLVSLGPDRTLFDVARLRSDLEEILDAPVDVVVDAGLTGEVADEIYADAIEL